MSTIKSSAENLTLNADGANNDIKFQSNGSEVASIDQAGTIQINGNLKGKSDNTSEIGNPYNAGGIKRVRMVQGGEIHFGDTTTSNFIGITEGTVNQFSDEDRIGLYTRNELKIYGNDNALRFTLDGDGLKFGTDTAAVNALDDYEEGTWTIVLTGDSSGSGNLTTGFYTKIGRMVHCSFTVSNVTFPTFSGNLNLSLPFTGASDSSTTINRQENSGDIYFYPLAKWSTGSTFTGLNFHINGSNATKGFFQVKEVNTNRQSQLHSNQGAISGASGMYCRFSITYTAS